MYKNVYRYISHLLLLSVQPQNVTSIFKIYFKHTTVISVFYNVNNIYI